MDDKSKARRILHSLGIRGGTVYLSDTIEVWQEGKLTLEVDWNTNVVASGTNDRSFKRFRFVDVDED